jgi:ATP-dependent helicase HepA
MAWTPGDYLTHRFNPDLGIGRITAIENRAIVVEFPGPGTTLRLAATTDALAPIDLDPGRPVRVVATREETAIVQRQPDGSLRLANGQTVAAGDIWPLALEGTLVERLALGDIDSDADFALRLDWLRLLSLREAGGLGSFLGGRVKLFPHQLYVAERATAIDPVRWLLADEVGLGKTIEAALILNRLVHTGQVRSCLVVAPEALTVQWLGELWRKYHQVFTLLDASRLADVERDFGAGFNPFELHRRAVIALELLVDRPHLTEQAVAAGIDLLIVDEAQRLRRPPGHPGEPAWRAAAPIAALGRHVLLLSATPLEDDAHGFFRLLQMLRPRDFPEDVDFEQRLTGGEPLPPCTSATRRVDIGGLPPRVGNPVVLGSSGGWPLRTQVEGQVRHAPASDPVTRRKKSERIRRVLSSGAALRPLLSPDELTLRRQVDTLDASDPRLLWLLSQVRRWSDAGEKTLIFVAYRETLEMLRGALSDRAQTSSGVFHEELSPARRDTEVVRFRAAEGPSVLVSTECGGEGRNFEFCRRLVLYDLPWKPSVVEQRIGRLDRIGRQMPVEIVYFIPPAGIGHDVVRLFEAVGLFREAMAGVEPQLAPLEGALEEAALDPAGSLTSDHFDLLVADARAARSRIREAAYRELHREPYRPDMAAFILSRVPADLDTLNESVVVRACSRLGFTIERPRGRRTYAIELGHEALVDNLPGVPGGAAFVGTFDRETAVENELLDFFASGHPLVEGVFAHFEESSFGRVSRLVLESNQERGEGLIAVYKESHGFEVIAWDRDGRQRPEWAALIASGQAALRPLSRREQDADRWTATIRALAPRMDAARRPHALAGVIVRPAPLTRE